jgi:hypothetical protein
MHEVKKCNKINCITERNFVIGMSVGTKLYLTNIIPRVTIMVVKFGFKTKMNLRN